MQRTTRTEIEGRRLSSAGKGMVVILLAIVFGLLLDARGLHKSAFNQPAGSERTVALALTAGLTGVSDAL